MSTVYLILGSNMGDRISNIQTATKFLADKSDIKILDSTTFYETEPYGKKTDKWFVNAGIKIETNLKPDELLEILQNIEQKMGRNRSAETHWGDRIIDIDIIFYDDIIYENPTLTIPHKLAHKRAFVLIPLMELDPNLKHPSFNKTISELYDEIENPEDVYLYGTRGLEDLDV